MAFIQRLRLHKNKIVPFNLDKNHLSNCETLNNFLIRAHNQTITKAKNLSYGKTEYEHSTFQWTGEKPKKKQTNHVK